MGGIASAMTDSTSGTTNLVAELEGTLWCREQMSWTAAGVGPRWQRMSSSPVWSGARARPCCWCPDGRCQPRCSSIKIDELGGSFRVIGVDPRGHGRSARTPHGNTYPQQGQDLASFVRELDLDMVHLIGWSYGALAAYAYFDLSGSRMRLPSLTCGFRLRARTR
jgi:alpha/beta hydrolase fold